MHSLTCTFVTIKDPVSTILKNLIFLRLLIIHSQLWKARSKLLTFMYLAFSMISVLWAPSLTVWHYIKIYAILNKNIKVLWVCGDNMKRDAGWLTNDHMLHHGLFPYCLCYRDWDILSRCTTCTFVLWMSICPLYKSVRLCTFLCCDWQTKSPTLLTLHLLQSDSRLPDI